MSLIKHTHHLQSPKFAKKKKKKLIGLVVIICFLVLVIFAGFIAILNLPFLQIHDFEIRGASAVSPDTIRTKSLSVLNGKYLGVIPKSNILFYPADSVISSLKDNFKTIDAVRLKRGSLSKIIVTLKERQPSAIVCAGFRDDNEGNDAENPLNNCYFSDNHGFVYEKSQIASSTYNKYYVPTDGGEIAIGTNFLSEDKFNALQVFVNGTAKAGLVPLGVLIGDNGEYEMYVKPDTTIYFDDRAPFDSTLSNLQVFWQNEANKPKATSTPAYDYINLRFGNTIYYSKQ